MQPLLDVGRLRLLHEVARRGTIAGAARSLGLTPSAVSQQLSVLEREVGLPLLDRSSRGVVLTGAGLALCERAGQVLDVLASARADLDRLGDDVAGAVRVATVASAALEFVSAAASALGAQHPGITLQVSTSEPARSMELLLAGDVDLAVIDEYAYQPIAVPDSVDSVPLRVEELVAVLPSARSESSGYSTEAEAPVRLSDLQDRDWVMPPDEAACGFAVRSACRAAGFEPRVRWETDDMLLLTSAVAAGHGIAVLPALAVDVGVGGVRVAALVDPAMTRTLSLVARSVTLRRPVVATVCKAMEAAAAVG